MAPLPPEVLLNAARERVIELQQQEDDLGDTIRDYYRELFTEFRAQLEAWFAVRFAYSRDPVTQETVWDPSSPRAKEALAYWTDQLEALITAAAPHIEDLLDSELDGAYRESYDHAQWMLALNGVPLGEPPAPGSPSAVHAALLAAGVAGLSYLERFAVWNRDVERRWSRVFKAHVMGGRTGRETLDAFDQLANTFVGRVEGLAANELHRAGSLGATTALDPYRDQLAGEVWLIRDDAACPICKAKHLTITTEQPITDSHPGCRCTKVPVAIHFRNNPVDYATFLRSLGRR